MAPEDPESEGEEAYIPSGYWDDPEIERLWIEEAERRYQEILDGKVETVPGEEVIRRLRAALHRSS